MFYHMTARSTCPTCNSLDEVAVVVGVLEAHKQMQSCVPMCNQMMSPKYYLVQHVYVNEILRASVSHDDTMQSYLCSNFSDTIHYKYQFSPLFLLLSLSPVKLMRGNRRQRRKNGNSVTRSLSFVLIEDE